MNTEHRNAGTVTTLENGPLMVEGEISVLNSSGEQIHAGDKVILCRCGASGNKPFCDGAHRAAGFEAT